ncbi:hypothetical protein ACFX1Q_033975 [Malus domestica]
MVQVLRRMEKMSLETRGEVSRLCSLTRSLQRRLDLEFSTSRGDYEDVLKEPCPEKESVVPLFSLLGEEKYRGKTKERFEVYQPVVEQISEVEFPDLLLFSLYSRGQDGQDRKRYGIPYIIGESSGKSEPTTVDKPPPYRPPPLASQGGGTKWRRP